MNNEQSQMMDYAEREALKRFAVRCAADGDVQSLERALIMIAHWMRQNTRVPFAEYAGQWTEAQKDRSDGQHSTPAMADVWPFSGKSCMHPAGSDYYPYGVGNKADEETEIRHAIKVIKSQYPEAGVDGMMSGSAEPMDSFDFVTEIKSCISWLRIHNLTNQHIQSFPVSNPTSYGFKHLVERENKRKSEGWQHPPYIRNGAFIVAMVVCGYKLKPAGKVNALFNISRTAVKKILPIE